MKPQTVDEYIEAFPEAHKAKLVEMRRIIRSVLPDTDEVLKWGSPAMVEKDGMILIVYSGHKQHINLVGTPSTKTAFDKELAEYEMGKGSFKLYYDKPLPTDLIKRFVKYRAQEYRTNKVNWK